MTAPTFDDHGSGKSDITRHHDSNTLRTCARSRIPSHFWTSKGSVDTLLLDASTYLAWEIARLHHHHASFEPVLRAWQPLAHRFSRSSELFLFSGRFWACYATKTAKAPDSTSHLDLPSESNPVAVMGA